MLRSVNTSNTVNEQVSRNCPFESTNTDFGNAVGIFRAYVSPLIAIIGIFGNALIIVVFSKEKPRTRFSIFAISLAIAHALSLLLNTILDDFVGRGLWHLTNGYLAVKLDSSSPAACKLLEYLPKVMYFAASYLVVFFSIDRTLTIYNPLRFNSFFHRGWATGACLFVYLVSFLGNAPLLVLQTLQKDLKADLKITCGMDREYPRLSKFSIFFSTVGTFFLPVIAVLVLNILIIIRLWQIHKWRRNQLLIKTRVMLELGRAAGHLALSTCFLLLYIPVGFVVLVRLHFTEEHGDDQSASARRIADLSRLFSSVKDISYAVNIVIYSVFLANFRQRLLRFLCCACVACRHMEAPTTDTNEEAAAAAAAVVEEEPNEGEQTVVSRRKQSLVETIYAIEKCSVLTEPIQNAREQS